MSKNITIKEGDTSRNFTASKLRTNLQGGGSCDWVPLDEVDEYVDLEELSVTQNGFYYPQEKVGFSRVSVNVEGGGTGDLGGSPVDAIAQGDIPAWSTVAVQQRHAGEATLLQSSIPSGADVGFGNKKIYYSANGTDVYRLNVDDLTGTPEIYKAVTTQASFQRNLMSYQIIEEGINHYYIENFDYSTVIEMQNPYASSQNIGNVFLAKDYFKLTENNDPKLWGINPLARGMGAAYGCGYPVDANNAGYSLVRYYGNTYLRWYTNTSSYSDNMVDSSSAYVFSLEDTAMVDGKVLIVKISDQKLCYAVPGTDGYEELDLVSDVSLQRIFMFDAEGSRCYANLGSYGLAVFTGEGLNYDLYSNITGIDSSKCCLFSHYFWDGANLWDLNTESTMVASRSKDAGQLLGYVKEDIANNTHGTAYILFS